MLPGVQSIEVFAYTLELSRIFVELSLNLDMPIGPKKNDGSLTPTSSPAISRRFLSSVPEKGIDRSSTTPEMGRKRVDRIMPSMNVQSANRDLELHGAPPRGVGYHLSPRTLRRLEHKHQVAKLRQENKLDILGQESSSLRFSPPVSPQTARRLIVLKGGANTRRFTVARTR